MQTGAVDRSCVKRLEDEVAWNAVADAEAREPTCDFPLVRAADEPAACDAMGRALGAATRERLERDGSALDVLRAELQRVEAAAAAAAAAAMNGGGSSIFAAAAAPSAEATAPPSTASLHAPPMSAAQIVASTAHRTVASNREDMERKAEALRRAMERAGVGNELCLGRADC